MAAVTEVGSTLLMKCLDFCQALSSHLLLGHQEQGSKPSVQEEGKPLHPQEECQAERGLSLAEA